MKIHDAIIFLGLLASTTLAGCASLQPLAPPADVRQGVVEADLQLAAVEGRPQGLVLEVEGAIGAEAVALSLFRVVADADPVILQTVPIDSRLREAIGGDGVQLVDREIPVSGRVSYQLAVRGADEEVVSRSNLVTVAWSSPPPRPDEVFATARFTDAVELRWPARPDVGAVVLRRNVLDADARFERVATVAAKTGVWVDRDVSAAGVWSYRVAYALQQTEFVQLGELSEEVYASTPEQR